MPEPNIDLKIGISDLSDTSLGELADLDDEFVDQEVRWLLRTYGFRDRRWDDNGCAARFRRDP